MTNSANGALRSGPKLYDSDLLAPRKACAVARYLDADVAFVYLDVRKGEHKTPSYLAINPNGTVPALTDGELALWEADAIICHLAERAGSDLWPRDPRRQIEIIKWLSWNSQHFLRFGGALYFEYVIKARFGIGGPDEAAVSEAQDSFRQYGGVLNDHLDGRRWLMGDAPTVADFSVGIVLPYAGQAHMPLDEFPQMRRWHDQLNDMEAWRDPFPAR